MENKKFGIIFNSKSELENFGKENLYNSLLDVIKDIPSNFILKEHFINNIYYSLFNIKSENSLYFDRKSIDFLKEDLLTFSKKLYEYILFIYNKSDFLSLYAKFHINFSFTQMDYYDENGIKVDNVYDLKLLIKDDYGKKSLYFRLLNVDKINNIIEEVNKLNISDNLKKEYMTYIKYINNTNDCNMKYLRECIKENFKENVNEYIYENDGKFTSQVYSLKELQLEKYILKYLKEKSVLKNIINEVLELEYVDDNYLIVKCLGDKLTEIKRYAHTEYRLSY